MRQFGFFGIWMRDVLIGTTGFLLAWLAVYMLYYLYRTRVQGRQVRAVHSVVAFALLIFIFTLPYPAWLLERPLKVWTTRLEKNHTVPEDSLQHDTKGAPPVVLVLGGGVLEPGRLNSQSLKRLEHGMTLWRTLPGAFLLVTEGGLGREGGDEGRAARRFITCQGVPPERLLLEVKAANTRQNMVFSKRRLDTIEHGEIVLVTTDRHMPRAYLAARRVGFEPSVSAVETTADLRFYPRWNALSHLSAVLNEYAGLLGYFFADWI